MLTVANTEEVVASRLGGMIDQVREITEDPSQPSILQSASWSARKLGYTVASLLTVTDTELDEVTAADVDVFLDLTELRVLASLPGNLPAVDTTVGPQSVKLSTLLPALEAMIKRRTAEVQAEHGHRIPGVSSDRRRAKMILP